MAPGWSLVLRLGRCWENDKRGIFKNKRDREKEGQKNNFRSGSRRFRSSAQHHPPHFSQVLVQTGMGGGSDGVWRARERDSRVFFFCSCCHLCLPFYLGSPHLTGWHQSLVSSLLLTLRMTPPSGGGACGNWHVRLTRRRSWKSREHLNPRWRRAPPQVEKHQEKKRNRNKTRLNAQIQHEDFTVLKKRLVHRNQRMNWLQS